MHTGGKSWGVSNCSFCQNPLGGGVKAFRKNCQGRPSILGIIALLLPSDMKFNLGVSYIYPNPLTPSPLNHHVCIYGCY